MFGAAGPVGIAFTVAVAEATDVQPLDVFVTVKV